MVQSAENWKKIDYFEILKISTFSRKLWKKWNIIRKLYSFMISVFIRNQRSREIRKFPKRKKKMSRTHTTTLSALCFWKSLEKQIEIIDLPHFRSIRRYLVQTMVLILQYGLSRRRLNTTAKSRQIIIDLSLGVRFYRKQSLCLNVENSFIDDECYNLVSWWLF